MNPEKDLQLIKEKITRQNDKHKKYFLKKYIEDRSGSLRNNIKNVTMDDGSIYRGELTPEGKKTGKGVINYSNGDTYLGEFQNDGFHGKGVYIFKCGDRYEGELLNGKKHGFGRYYYINGNKYEGEW